MQPFSGMAARHYSVNEVIRLVDKLDDEIDSLWKRIYYLVLSMSIGCICLAIPPTFFEWVELYEKQSESSIWRFLMILFSLCP